MSGFADVCGRWVARTRQRLEAVKTALPRAVRGSIVDGSPVTGAPGQPVVSGDLDESWTITATDHGARVATDHPEAPVIEAGTRRGRPITYQHGGGPHSVALTRAGFPELVRQVAAEVAEA